MKVIVKVPFYDDNGVHKPGEKVEVKVFDESRMELVEEKKPSKKVSK